MTAGRRETNGIHSFHPAIRRLIEIEPEVTALAPLRIARALAEDPARRWASSRPVRSARAWGAGIGQVVEKFA